MSKYALTYSANATWGSTDTIIFSMAMTVDEFDKPENVKKLLEEYGAEDAEYVVQERLYYIRNCDDTDVVFGGENE